MVIHLVHTMKSAFICLAPTMNSMTPTNPSCIPTPPITPRPVCLNNLQILHLIWTDWRHTAVLRESLSPEKAKPSGWHQLSQHSPKQGCSGCSLTYPPRKLQRYWPHSIYSGCGLSHHLHITHTQVTKALTLRTELHAQLWIGMTWGRTTSANSPSLIYALCYRNKQGGGSH